VKEIKLEFESFDES